MPLPTIIPPTSGRQMHFLAIADIYLDMNQPPVFEVEPNTQCEYRPDAKVVTEKGVNLFIECQRTRISNPKMQDKINAFAKTTGTHGVHVLMIYYDAVPFEITQPYGVKVVQRQLPPRT